MNYVDPMKALNDQQREQRLNALKNLKEEDKRPHGKTEDGLTRRDYFAAAAFHALVVKNEDSGLDLIATAVQAADALIAKLDGVKK